MSTHYNVDHLTLEEIKEVMQAVWQNYKEAFADNSSAMDDLSEEYQFWSGVYEKRLEDDETLEDDTGAGGT